MADEITFTCPCGARFSVPEKLAGLYSWLCPACTLKRALAQPLFAAAPVPSATESRPAPASSRPRLQRSRWPLATLALLCAAGLTWWLWPSAAPEQPRPAGRPSPLDLLSADQIPDRLRYKDQPAELVGVLRSPKRSAWPPSQRAAHSADERWRASIEKDIIRLCDLTTGTEVAVLDGYKTPEPPPNPFGFQPFSLNRERGTVDGIALSADGSMLAVLGSHTTEKTFHFNPDTMSAGPSKEEYRWLQLWDWKKDSLVPREPLAWQDAPWGKTAAFSPDGRVLATGSFAHADKVQLWKLGEGKLEEFAEVPGPAGSVDFLLFAPDGRGLVTGRGHSLILWDVTDALPGGRRDALFTRSWIILAVPFCGLVVVVALAALCRRMGWEERAWVRRTFQRAAVADALLLVGCLALLAWNYFSSGVTKRAAFDLTTGEVTGAAFSADGRLLAAHADREARVWDAATGEVRHHWSLPNPIERLAFAADERHLAAHTADGTAYVLRLGDLDETQHLYDCCEAVLRQDPDDVDARLGRAQAHLRKGKYDDALADVAAALRRAPQCRDAYFLRGLIHKQTGDAAQALEDFTEAIRLDVKYAAAYYQRGLVHAKTGAFARAKEDFEEAVRLDPRLAAE
jgi:tetratricopeptide (TPR) repeat protein